MGYTQERNGARFTVRGSITDSLSGKSLQQATLSLQHKYNKPMVKYGIVNAQGNFSVGVGDTGLYILKISMAGYALLQREVAIRETVTEMGVLKLSVQQTNLKEVVVTSRKPLIEQTDDKIVYNTESDPSAKTETAIEILRKTPFISVDGDDNIQLNGQSNFKVLLNGKETAMFAQNVKQALRGFPGALIVKIEVITSPSAKYDAEGVGGIINIVTKKKIVGYNGDVSTFFSTNNNYSLNADLSVKAGQLGITGYYGLSGIKNNRSQTSLATTPLLPSVFTGRTMTGERVQNNNYSLFNLEFSYDIDSLNTISWYGDASSGNYDYDLNQMQTTTYPTQPNDIGRFTQQTRSATPGFSAGMDYTRRFTSNPDKEFSIRFNGSFSKSDSYMNSWQDNPSFDRYVIGTSKSGNNEYTLQTDYTLPLAKKQKLEIGAKAILRDASSDFENLLKYNAGDSYKPQPSNTDRFNYRQEVYGAYASFNFAIKTYSFRVGMRFEQTSVLGNFTSSNTSVRQNYGNLVPNVQVTHKFGKSVTSVLSYSMRLQRPAISSLNPFVSNNDSLNQSYGNPNLNAQLTHSVSLQNRIQTGKTFIGITLYASHSDNSIAQYIFFNPATGVTSTTSANIGKETQLGISVNFNRPINKNWRINVNSSFRYNHITNTSDKSQEVGGPNGSGSLSTNYKISNRFTISGSAYFVQGQRSLTTYSAATYGHQINFAYKFFNEKLTVQANFNNMQQKNFMLRSYTSNNAVKNETVSTVPWRVIFFGVIWNFGKLKESVSKKKGVNNDDLL